jgi:esterase/lipase superfamily enzyme
MPLAVYGTFGLPLLMLPTAAADFEEYERFQLINEIAPYVYSGKVKIFTINSINRDSWLNDRVHPGESAYRTTQYCKYISEEVVPFIYHHCRTADLPIAVTGASFGAFHAANVAFKYPDKFRTLIAMSGFYDLRNYFGGYYDDNCYFNNPADYLPKLTDPYYLEKLRHDLRIIIVTGQGPYEAPDASRRLSNILNSKNIPHVLDIWGYDVPHDWPTWRSMLKYYIPKLF